MTPTRTVLTDEQIDAVISVASRRLAETGYSAYMGAKRWNRAVARAAEAATLAASTPAAPQADAALENCRLFAARHRKEDWAATILRFCADGGSVGSPLRSAPTEPAKGDAL